LANITLLHWNIQNFSNNKLTNTNGGSLINFIAAVVGRIRPNIISLQEVKFNAATAVVNQLIPAINLAMGQGPPAANRWQRIIVNNLKNHEAYVILYQTGNNFTLRTPAGLTNQRLTMGALGANSLQFNSSLTKHGGRKPYYATFRTSDTNHDFTVVTYHAMFGYWSGVGVRNVGLVGQCTNVDFPTGEVNLQASFTCGDFNVNFDFFVPGDYNNLLQLPSWAAVFGKTTLKATTPPAGYDYAHEYLSSAYDNIFQFNQNVMAPGFGEVTDLITDSTQGAYNGGQISAQAGAFNPNFIQRGDLIGPLPPLTFEDSWHIVRHAVSDHLPVSVTMTI
jgi:hypothetical protein